MNKDADIILHFWFEEAGPDRWWKKDKAFDYEISQRFKHLMEAAAKGEFDGWANDRFETLALILLLDQFPRNAYRDTERAFATDQKARFLAHLALERDFLKGLNQDQCAFMIMPLVHSEDLDDQHLCCELFRAMKAEGYLKFAEAHRKIIVEFGRFPHRNATLGRPSTPEEKKYLKDPKAGF